ncbi:MAG TPA: acyl-CoA dehydrogenase family protein [Chloroflexota bacterium]|nr:acyl-CoA dehydrogenase family protein [Chloroflexota bacterium]
MNDPVTEKQARQVAEEAREQSWVRPSFGKELFLGRLRLDLIHPHPQPSPDDRAKGEAFLERLESFLSTVDPLRIERDARIPDDVIEGLAALGAFGMNIDEKYGGQGLSQVYYNRALILASSVHSAIGTLLSAHQSIGVPKPLKYFGTDEQKQRYLPRVAAGEISAFLLTEPDVGSDPARMSTTAELSPDGRTYILNGTKLWITNGPLAKIMLVMARVPKTEGHRGGLTAFALEGDTPGIVIERRNEFMGIHGIENALIRLENVRVPAENMIGEEGRGLKIALTTLNTGRLSIPATSAGLGRYALKVVREFGRDRVQWGKPIGKHDAVAQKIAFIAGTSFAMDAVSELGAALADEEHNDIRIEAAVAKLWCTEMSWKVADDMVQVLGGRGYETAASLKARGEKPIPAEQMLRDVRVSRIFEGSSEIMRLFIAREAVDQHMQVAGALAEREATPQQKVEAALKASTFYVPWMVKLSYGPGLSPNSYAEFGRLATHLRFVERASRRLARWTFYGMLRWQAHLELRQSYLGRLVDIGAELFAMSASVVRAQMLGTEEAVELADLFCRGSRLRVEALFRGLRRNEDDVNYRAAQRALDGRYDFIEQGILDPAELIARGGMDSEELTTEEGSALVS